jgi:predicted nucleic acid-binding protein
MTLCDTGIIVALISRTDQHYQRCVGLMKTWHDPLMTTWPCITEAMHILGTPPNQEALRQMIETGFLSLAMPTLEDALRVCALMRRYADAPMDFADASLVVAAETLGLTRILTLDHHFYAYQIHGRTPFDVSP